VGLDGIMGVMALDLPCPYCGEQMYAEQAHNRCPRCRYIEPCCDGAPQAVCRPATTATAAVTVAASMATPTAATAVPAAR
jgi:hypothetical protein